MCWSPRWMLVTKKDGTKRKMLVSCGQCLECLKGQSQKWALRCLSEARKYSDVCFITLTYNEAHKPDCGSLKRSDLQNFMKRLRKFVAPKKIRFFYCGEYGKRGLRPHYHIMIFGWKPNDLVFWKKDGKDPLFRSRIIEKLWSVYSCDELGKSYFDSIGFSTVGDITFDTAMYCAKYLQKTQPTPPGCCPPFTGMSRRPGLGIDLLSPQLLIDGGLYYRGKSVSVPRYFIDKLSESHDLSSWKERRYQASLHRYFCTDKHIRREKLFKYSELLLTKNLLRDMMVSRLKDG